MELKKLFVYMFLVVTAYTLANNLSAAVQVAVIFIVQFSGR